MTQSILTLHQVHRFMAAWNPTPALPRGLIGVGSLDAQALGVDESAHVVGGVGVVEVEDLLPCDRLQIINMCGESDTRFGLVCGH